MIVCVNGGNDVDNNADKIQDNPEGADYDVWLCCVIQLLPMAKQINNTRSVCQQKVLSSK